MEIKELNGQNLRVGALYLEQNESDGFVEGMSRHRGIVNGGQVVSVEENKFGYISLGDGRLHSVPFSEYSVVRGGEMCVQIGYNLRKEPVLEVLIHEEDLRNVERFERLQEDVCSSFSQLRFFGRDSVIAQPKD